MVVVVGYYVADLLSTSGPLLASSLSNKSVLYVSTKPPLSNGWVAIRKILSQLHKTKEEKANARFLEEMTMSTDTGLLANQKHKPKREHLDYFKVVDIINEEFKSTLKPLTVRQYFEQGPIYCSRLKRGFHGTVVEDVAYPILLRLYITHY